MAEEDFETFYLAATEKFGEKFTIKPIQIKEEYIQKFNDFHGGTCTKEDFENYKAVWLLEPVCPSCGKDLNGIFGGFTWGLVHGNGYCGYCKNVNIQLYHYIKDSKKPFSGYSLIGF